MHCYLCSLWCHSVEDDSVTLSSWHTWLGNTATASLPGGATAHTREWMNSRGKIAITLWCLPYVCASEPSPCDKLLASFIGNKWLILVLRPTVAATQTYIDTSAQKNPIRPLCKVTVDTIMPGLYNSPRARFASSLTPQFIEVSIQQRLQQVALYRAWTKGQVHSDCSKRRSFVMVWNPVAFILCRCSLHVHHSPLANKQAGGQSHGREHTGNIMSRI